MRFFKVSSTDVVANFIADKLASALKAGKSVLWLVPGGSAISVAVEASKQLKGLDLSRLTVSLTDERYGSVGHDDSNWLQLEQAGFHMEGANMQPVLISESRERTTDEFSNNLEKIITGSGYSLGLFGIGPDGHTAGILPGSPAVDADKFASSYQAANFERITMTPRAIARLDEAVVYVMDEAKWPILDQLEQDVELDKQPAQALKTVPELIVFNDYKGEEL